MTRSPAPGRVPPTVVDILRDLNPLLGDRNSNRKWNLDGVNPKTLRRWFNGEEPPSPAAARAVAMEIWRRLDDEPSGNLRRDVMARLAAVLPPEPPHGWSEASFGAWFFERASGVGTNEPSRPAMVLSNPFLHRSAVSGPHFFGRRNELQRICDTVIARQNLQVVGPRSMGKSSLLREAAERITSWVGPCLIAFVDMHLPEARTQPGWLAQVARQWGWTGTFGSLRELSIRLDLELRHGRRVVLVLDSVDAFVGLAEEFPISFFEGLRACGQLGMSILTGSQRTLRAIREQGGALSAHYNTFSLKDLGCWHETEAREFVVAPRANIPPFDSTEIEIILDFGRCHPLRLQVACFHVLESRRLGGSLQEALAAAAREMLELGDPGGSSANPR